MLTNGQGKERLRSNATARKPFQWRMNFMSTGEVTTAEKIEAGGRHKVMAGQEVRTINLPILGANGENSFKNLHGFKTPADLSEHLKRASREVYGTLIRAFIAALCGSTPDELHANAETISQHVRDFVERVCPKEGAGQLRRVANKFGLIAAAGIFAARHGLLPWSPEEAEKVAEEWFAIWLNNRGGTGNLEVEQAIKAIQADWELHWTNHYHDLDCSRDPSGFPRELHGYYRVKDGELEVYILANFLPRLIGSVNRDELYKTMQERGMLIMTDKGTRKETLSVNSSIGKHNVRILGVRPNTRQTEDVETTPASTSGKLYDPSDNLADDVF